MTDQDWDTRYRQWANSNNLSILKWAAISVAAIVCVILFIMSVNMREATRTRYPDPKPAGMSESEYRYVQDKLHQSGIHGQEADTMTRAINNQRLQGK